eukprot:jgi/Mesvir1/28609/Mv01024-RA.1
MSLHDMFGIQLEKTKKSNSVRIALSNLTTDRTGAIGNLSQHAGRCHSNGLKPACDSGVPERPLHARKLGLKMKWVKLPQSHRGCVVRRVVKEAGRHRGMPTRCSMNDGNSSQVKSQMENVWTLLIRMLRLKDRLEMVLTTRAQEQRMFEAHRQLLLQQETAFLRGELAELEWLLGMRAGAKEEGSVPGEGEGESPRQVPSLAATQPLPTPSPLIPAGDPSRPPGDGGADAGAAIANFLRMPSSPVAPQEVARPSPQDDADDGRWAGLGAEHDRWASLRAPKAADAPEEMRTEAWRRRQKIEAAIARLLPRQRPAESEAAPPPPASNTSAGQVTEARGDPSLKGGEQVPERSGAGDRSASSPAVSMGSSQADASVGLNVRTEEGAGAETVASAGAASMSAGARNPGWPLAADPFEAQAESRLTADPRREPGAGVREEPTSGGGGGGGGGELLRRDLPQASQVGEAPEGADVQANLQGRGGGGTGAAQVVPPGGDQGASLDSIVTSTLERQRLLREKIAALRGPVAEGGNPRPWDAVVATSPQPGMGQGSLPSAGTGQSVLSSSGGAQAFGHTDEGMQGLPSDARPAAGETAVEPGGGAGPAQDATGEKEEFLFIRPPRPPQKPSEMTSAWERRRAIEEVMWKQLTELAQQRAQAEGNKPLDPSSLFEDDVQ